MGLHLEMLFAQIPFLFSPLWHSVWTLAGFGTGIVATGCFWLGEITKCIYVMEMVGMIGDSSLL
jgi:hypothetical protein